MTFPLPMPPALSSSAYVNNVSGLTRALEQFPGATPMAQHVAPARHQRHQQQQQQNQQQPMYPPHARFIRFSAPQLDFVGNLAKGDTVAHCCCFRSHLSPQPMNLSVCHLGCSFLRLVCGWPRFLLRTQRQRQLIISLDVGALLGNDNFIILV